MNAQHSPVSTQVKSLLRQVPGARSAYRFLRTTLQKARFRRDRSAFQAAYRDDPRRLVLPMDRRDQRVCLGDDVPLPIDHHYLYHPAWAARVLAETRPTEHVDISSILSFSAVLSAFIPVRYYEYRPPAVRMDGLSCASADLLQLPFPDQSLASLSCMHTLEHIGLGRYGDPIDPSGDLKAAAELQRVLAPGGTLLMVVPVGRPRVSFNGQRTYSCEMVLEMFSELRLREFALIHEDGSGITRHASPTAESVGCGCFWFVRE